MKVHHNELSCVESTIEKKVEIIFFDNKQNNQYIYWTELFQNVSQRNSLSQSLSMK